MFGLDAVPDGLPPEEGLDRTMVSGDVLFAGSIGRTDLPGGRPVQVSRDPFFDMPYQAPATEAAPAWEAGTKRSPAACPATSSPSAKWLRCSSGLSF